MGHLAIWDIAFALGVFTQLMKIADWILRPKQQNWVRDLCDSITLRLEYTKPLTWFRNVQQHRTQYLVISGASVIFLLLLYSKFQVVQNSASIATFLLLWCIPTAFVFYRWGTGWIRWLYGDGRFRPFILKYLGFVFGGFLIICSIFSIQIAVVLPLVFLMNKLDPSGLWLRIVVFFYLLVVVPVAGVLGAWWIVIVSGYFVILMQIILIVLACVVAVLRAIAWRVVEYNKGPVAALSLLLTTACGFIAAYLHISLTP